MASIFDTSHLSWHTSSNDNPILGFSDRCKFEHPGQSTFASGNRFGALSGGGFGGMPGLFVSARLNSPAFVSTLFNVGSIAERHYSLHGLDLHGTWLRRCPDSYWSLLLKSHSLWPYGLSIADLANRYQVHNGNSGLSTLGIAQFINLLTSAQLWSKRERYQTRLDCEQRAAGMGLLRLWPWAKCSQAALRRVPTGTELRRVAPAPLRSGCEG